MILKHGKLTKIFSWIAIIGLATTLGACSKDDDEKVKQNEVKNKSIVLSENGIGPINSGSSFNMHQMTLAFSQYNVVEELNYQTGTPYPVIRVSDGVKTLLVINPDESQKNIFSIIIEDNLITNSLGHRLGTSYSDIYTYGQTEECQAGAQDMQGKALCYAPKTPNILYIFSGKKSNSNTEVPPADVLQTWALESIIWRPK